MMTIVGRVAWKGKFEMGTDLDTTMCTVREAIDYAIECGIDRGSLEQALHEVMTDVRHKRPLLPDVEGTEKIDGR